MDEVTGPEAATRSLAKEAFDTIKKLWEWGPSQIALGVLCFVVVYAWQACGPSSSSAAAPSLRPASGLFVAPQEPLVPLDILAVDSTSHTCADQLAAAAIEPRDVDCAHVNLAPPIPVGLRTHSLNLSYATVGSDLNVHGVEIGKLELRGAKVGTLSVKSEACDAGLPTFVETVTIGNADIGTLELEVGDGGAAVAIGRLEISNSRLRALELRGAVVNQLIIRSSTVESIVLERSSVTEQLEVESVETKGKFAIMSSHVKDLRVITSSFHEIEARPADKKEDEDPPQPGSNIEKWEMRTVQVPSVKVDASSVGRIDFDSVTSPGRLKLEGALVQTFELNASSVGRLAMDAKSKTKLQTKLGGMSISNSKITRWDVADGTTLGDSPSVSGSSFETVSLKGTRAEEIDFGTSSVKQLDLGDAMSWKGGDVSSFEHERATEGVLAHLRRNSAFNHHAWTAFEKQLRDQGSQRQANQVHVAGLQRSRRLPQSGTPSRWV